MILTPRPTHIPSHRAAAAVYHFVRGHIAAAAAARAAAARVAAADAAVAAAFAAHAAVSAASFSRGASTIRWSRWRPFGHQHWQL